MLICACGSWAETSDSLKKLFTFPVIFFQTVRTQEQQLGIECDKLKAENEHLNMRQAELTDENEVRDKWLM